MSETAQRPTTYVVTGDQIVRLSVLIGDLHDIREQLYAAAEAIAELRAEVFMPDWETRPDEERDALWQAHIEAAEKSAAGRAEVRS